jgi:hypothetical protein
MRLLRTARDTFINGDTIIGLVRDDGGWLAILEGGEAVALASYYNEPGRIEQDLPHVLARRVPVETCAAEECCLNS